MIKNIIKKLIVSAVKMGNSSSVGRYVYNQVLHESMQQVYHVTHRDINLTLAAPNATCRFRADTFASKEPETLEWIDSIPLDSVVWDIGANVGLYSVYAAKKRNSHVWAFEPSVFNLEILARNIFMNNATEKVFIVPVALSDSSGQNKLRMTTTEWGGALSCFGQDFGWDGKPIKQIFEYSMMGLTMQDAIEKLGIPQPDYIKLDVDGIEHLILTGGQGVLKSVKGILIEVNEDFQQQMLQCERWLINAGLKLQAKKHSELIANSTEGFANSYNQIWTRS